MMTRRVTEQNEFVATLSFVLIFGLWGVLLKGAWFAYVPVLLRDCAWLGIAAIGQALLITSGEFDLSVGSVFAFIGSMFILSMRAGLGAFPALAIAMLISLAIGLANGFITLKFRVSSLIVTLGSLFIYRGLTQLITQGFPMPMPDHGRSSLPVMIMGREPFGFNNSILFLCAIAVVASLTLSKTKFGNHLYAAGGDSRSAAANGISVMRTRIITFVACSALAGFAGITSACHFSSVSATSGEGMEFETIAAAVIGGCSLRGGVGSVWGTLLGVGTLMALRAGLIMLGVNIFMYRILLGFLLVVFVALKKPLTHIL